jgi:hypothetical protein
MYLFCNLRIHVITLYLGHVCVYYASMLWCWHLVWILVRTDHLCLGMRCHKNTRIFYVMFSLSSLGLTMELVNIFIEFVSLWDPSRKIFDDDARIHEYLLCNVLDCGSDC